MELRSGRSFLSKHDARLHFGLGAESGVGRVEIRWPGGVTGELSNPDARRVVTVREGVGVVTSVSPVR